MSPIEIAEFELYTYLDSYIYPNIDEEHWENLLQLIKTYKRQIEVAHGRDTLMTAEQGRRIESMLKFLSQDIRGEEPYELGSESEHGLQ